MPDCPTEIDLAKHAEGSLDLEQVHQIENHLRACAACQKDIEVLRREQDLFADLANVVQSNERSNELPRFGPDESEFKTLIECRGYEIDREIHRGGQGIVYEAVQKSNDRRVAVKRLKLHNQPIRDQIARFEREVEVATRLSHPNIVTVFDNGAVGECPFLVMEYIKGSPLDRYVRQSLLDAASGDSTEEQLRAVLELFKRICGAISYAHRLGIIHRDLKPSNILIDQLGEPKILDFGLAKLIETPIQGLTQTGQFLGTLAYASPEQVQFDSSKEIDTRTDVYSLGVILYELVTGELPYPVDVGLSNAIKNITQKLPSRPSEINDRLDHDVETIVVKSLSKEPDRRYQSVEQLGRDIELYLNGQPIEAKRDHHVYVLYKSLLKFKGYMIATGALLVAIFMGLLASLWFWNQAVEQRNLATQAQNNETVARKEAELQSYIANIVATKGAVLNNDVAEAKRRLNAAPEKFRGWEWNHFKARADQSRSTFRIHQLFVTDFELSSSDKVLSIAGGNTLKRWDLHDQALTTEKSFGVGLDDIALATDGQHVAVVVNGNAIHVLDADTLVTEKVSDFGRRIVQVEFIGETEVLALQHETDGNHRLVIWDWSVDERRDIPVPSQSITAFSIQGNQPKIAVSGSNAGIYDLPKKQFYKIDIREYTQRVFYTEAPGRIAFATGNDVLIWDVANEKQIARLSGHEGPVKTGISLGFRSLVTGSDDGTIRFWDSTTGAEKTLLRGHDQPITNLVAIDQDTILSSSSDGTFKTWSTTPQGQPRRWTGHQFSVRDIQYNSDGTVATCAEDGQVIIRNATSGEVTRVLEHDKPLFTISFSPDGRFLAAAGDELSIRVWDLKYGTNYTLSGHTDRIHSVDHSPDGKLLISGSRDKTVRVWDLQSRTCIRVLNDHDECVHACVFHPEQEFFATRSHRDIRFWDSEDLREFERFQQRIGPEDYSLTFDPGGKLVAAGSSIEGFGRGYINVFEVATLANPQSLEQHNSPINAFVFFPSGKRAVSASNDSIKIWGMEYSSELANLDSVSAVPYCLAVSPDSRSVLAGTSSGEILIWDGFNPD